MESGLAPSITQPVEAKAKPRVSAARGRIKPDNVKMSNEVLSRVRTLHEPPGEECPLHCQSPSNRSTIPWQTSLACWIVDHIEVGPRSQAKALAALTDLRRRAVILGIIDQLAT